ARNEGIVRFVPLPESKTKIELEMHWEPKVVTERIGDVLGADDVRIQGDLGRFKKFIEERRAPTGAWRGEIRGGQVEGDRAEEDPTLDAKVWESLHIANAFEKAGNFDVIHNHYDFLPLTYAGLVTTPIVTTVHGFSSGRIRPAYRRYAGRVAYVSISDADRDPDLPYVATVYHGIDLSEFTPREQPGRGLVYFGRMHPDKGV